MFLDICKNLDFPAEAVEVLVQGLDQIRTDAAAVQDLQNAVDSLMTPECDKYLQLMQRISDQTGVHRYVVDMVVLLLAVEPLKVRYEQRGLPEQLMWDSMADLRYKLIECKDVYNIWGTFVTPWFKWFYTCNRFKLGRLEFEKTRFYREESYRGVSKGDPVVNIHIPSAGPLTRESVLDSLHLAYEFYKEDAVVDGLMTFTCHSWLLYPPHYEEVFPAGSNLRKFYELFDVLEGKAGENNGDFWRVFNRDYDPDILDQVPADTALRRNLLSYIKAGKRMGSSLGVIRYDGEKIVHA